METTPPMAFRLFSDIAIAYFSTKITLSKVVRTHIDIAMAYFPDFVFPRRNPSLCEKPHRDNDRD